MAELVFMGIGDPIKGWEEVDGVSNPSLKRLKVPGGWLYLAVLAGPPESTPSLVMTFVPTS